MISEKMPGTDREHEDAEPQAPGAVAPQAGAPAGEDASEEGTALEAGSTEAEEAAAFAEEAEPRKKRDFSYTQNRELSWLQFNRRVLEEALDETVPLYERLKFIAIFESNLDEFFMVRVGSLTDLMLIDPDERENKSNMTAAEQLDAIFAEVKTLSKLRDSIYRKTMDELSAYGIVELDLEKLSKKERKFARDYYREFLRPILSPQVIDARHPFPHLRNKTRYVATLLTDEDGVERMGIVPVPEEMPALVLNPDDPLSFVRVEQIVAHNVRKLFDIYETGTPCIISVTRNADISFDEEKFSDDEGDYRLHMSRLLKKRNRLNPVRLEVQGELDKTLRDMLLERLGLTKAQLFVSEAPLSLQSAYSFEKKLPPALKSELCYPPFSPRLSKTFDARRPILEQVEQRDRVLFYPYDSIDPFLRMLAEAASDPDVMSIKITLYRLASDSRVAQHLCEAAENGKDVTVLMELRARFDEANNIDWSEHLEEAGCNIIYGMENYKCHSKICLITRREGNKLVNFTQIGTGNYNEKTARLYTDICLFTANEEIGQDAVNFFQNMLIGNLNGAYDRLLVAPATMKRTIVKRIDEQIAKGSAGRITIKANSVTEREIIDKLAEASCAGVQIRMNIRGICCLLPGIEGKTDNVHVRSIVGQFLEHSRIYCFGEGDEAKMYISSADLMTRNLVHRVEVACPIYDEGIKASIQLFLDKIFADTIKTRTLQPDGRYVPVSQGRDAALHAGEPPFCMQDWCVEHPLQQFAAEKPKAGRHAKVRAAAPREKERAKPQAEAAQKQADAERPKTGWQKLRALFGGK